MKKRIVYNYVAQANTTTQIDVPLDSIDGYTPVLHTIDYTSSDLVVCDAGCILNKSLLRIYLTNKKNSDVSNTIGLSILYMKDL